MKKRLSLLICIALFICLSSLSIADDEIWTYEQLDTYGETFGVEKGVGDIPVEIEIVIGRVYSDSLSHFDMWIKSNNGYELRDAWQSSVGRYRFELVSGNRLILEITPYSDGSWGGDQVLSYEVIEEGVDWQAIQDKYKAEAFETASYKKVLRNIEDYAGKKICIEVTIFQEISESYGIYDALAMDDEGNIYYIKYDERIMDMCRLLLDDRIRIYGQVAKGKPIYEYQSLTGKRTVPYVGIEFVELLEED